MERYRLSFVQTFVGGIFLLIGIVLIAVGAVVFVNWSDFAQNAVPVYAEITDISSYSSKIRNKTENYYRVDIKYEYGGETYEGRLDKYVSAMHKGDRVEIFIDPDDPSSQRSRQTVIPIIFALSGLFFGAIGGSVLAKEIRFGCYINRLIADDMYVYADFAGEEPANLTVDGVRYDQAVFVYDGGSGRELRVTSKPYHPNKCPYVRGDVKKVYVDIENAPEKFYVSRNK